MTTRVLRTSAGPAERTARLGAGEVLIVDDQRNACQVIALGLREEGYEVDVATDLEGALEAIGAKQYDVLITDSLMRTIDAAELVEALRLRRRTTAVVVMSVFADGDIVPEAVKLGAVACIPKPFEWQVLLAKLAKLTRPKACGAEKCCGERAS